MLVHIIYPGHREVERLRGALREAMSVDYSGWSDDYDRQFDARSLWFALAEDARSPTLAALRLVFSELGALRGPLPMETADVSMPNRRAEGPAVEASGFWFRRWVHGMVVIHAMTTWILENDVRQLYALHDVRNSAIRGLHHGVLKLRPMPEARVSFSSFRSRADLTPVIWEVSSGDTPIFEGVRRRLERGKNDSARLVVAE